MNTPSPPHAPRRAAQRRQRRPGIPEWKNVKDIQIVTIFTSYRRQITLLKSSAVSVPKSLSATGKVFFQTQTTVL